MNPHDPFFHTAVSINLHSSMMILRRQTESYVSVALFIEKKRRTHQGCRQTLRHPVSPEPSRLGSVGSWHCSRAVTAIFGTRGRPQLLNTVQINTSETTPLFTTHTRRQQTHSSDNEALTFVM